MESRKKASFFHDWTKQSVQESAIVCEDDAIERIMRLISVNAYEADMYRIMLPWREGIDDPSNHELYLARAKELENPQTDGDKRIARDIVI